MKNESKIHESVFERRLVLKKGVIRCGTHGDDGLKITIEDPISNHGIKMKIGGDKVRPFFVNKRSALILANLFSEMHELFDED